MDFVADAVIREVATISDRLGRITQDLDQQPGRYRRPRVFFRDGSRQSGRVTFNTFSCLSSDSQVEKIGWVLNTRSVQETVVEQLMGV